MDQRAVLAVTVVSVISVAILVWLWEKKEKKKPDGPSPPDPPPSPPTPSIPLRPKDQKPLVPLNSPIYPVTPPLPHNTSIKRISLGNPMTNFASVAQIVPHGLASLSDVEKYFGASAPKLTGWVAEGFVRAGAVVSPCAYGNECVDQSAFAFIDVRKPRAGRVEIYFLDPNYQVFALNSDFGSTLMWDNVKNLPKIQNRIVELIAVPLNDQGLVNLVRNDNYGYMIGRPDAGPVTPRQVAAYLKKNQKFSIAAHMLRHSPTDKLTRLEWPAEGLYWHPEQDNQMSLSQNIDGDASPFSLIFDVDAGGRGDLAQVPPVFPVAPTYL